MKKLVLSDGADYEYDNQGKKIFVGSKMGRRDILPPDTDIPIKVRMERLRFVDGDYDQWGAYWGSGDPLYCAWNEVENVQIFVRAEDREDAKLQVRELLPQAKFYR